MITLNLVSCDFDITVRVLAEGKMRDYEMIKIIGDHLPTDKEKEMILDDIQEQVANFDLETELENRRWNL